MLTLKEQIIFLRNQGKSYLEISQELNCSKGTISFHCNSSVKERALFRQTCARNNIPFERKKTKVYSKPITEEKVSKENRTIDLKEKYCLTCKNVLTNTRADYCSQSCHQEARFLVRYEAWLKGNIEPYSRWIKKALSKLYGYKCSKCGISKWNDTAISLELEHKDGNSENNEISNLCLLCPNCHSQTPTYKGANKGNGRHFRRVRYAEGKSY